MTSGMSHVVSTVSESTSKRQKAHMPYILMYDKVCKKACGGMPKERIEKMFFSSKIQKLK